MILVITLPIVWQVLGNVHANSILKFVVVNLEQKKKVEP